MEEATIHFQNTLKSSSPNILQARTTPTASQPLNTLRLKRTPILNTSHMPYIPAMGIRVPHIITLSIESSHMDTANPATADDPIPMGPSVSR